MKKSSTMSEVSTKTINTKIASLEAKMSNFLDHTESLERRYWQEKNKGPLINEAMVNVMKDIGSVGKEKTNQAQKWKYRSADDVYNAVHQQMAIHGIFCLTTNIEKLHFEKVTQTKETKFGTKEQTTVHAVYKYDFKFVASDGSAIMTTAIGEAMDFGDKAIGKCATYAHKDALVRCFVIPFEDMKDPDAEVYSAPAVSTKEQNIRKAAKAMGLEVGKMLKSIGCNSIEDVTESKMEELRKLYKDSMSGNN